MTMFQVFQSTHPVRGGTFKFPQNAATTSRFQSTHPVRGGTVANQLFADIYIISIHPPRAGWDGIRLPPRYSGRYFNPPTPCGVGRPVQNHWRSCCTFQSTHPVRGGTVVTMPIASALLFQSTHPVRGGTFPAPLFWRNTSISIHPPRAGWDATTGCGSIDRG